MKWRRRQQQGGGVVLALVVLLLRAIFYNLFAPLGRAHPSLFFINWGILYGRTGMPLNLGVLYEVMFPTSRSLSSGPLYLLKAGKNVLGV